MATTAQRIVLASRPTGEPAPENFRLETVPVPKPGPGQLLLRTIWLSLDPYMRGRMNDLPSYVEPVKLDEVMGAGTVSEVMESNLPDFKPGDIVLSNSGWQTHELSDGKGLRKLDPKAAPPSTALGVLGMPGMTAYVGLLDIGKPKPGETVVVAAAAGAVGSAVGQIAKIKGARAVGIAGGAEKCRYVKDVLGFDACVDHRSATFRDDLKAACPQGIDVYFENVGGAVFEAVLPRLNRFARVPLCGMVAQYNDTGDSGRAISYLMRMMLIRRVTIQGFIVLDFASRTKDFVADMTKWYSEGRIKHRESIAEGLANAPQTFIALLRGANLGKQLVRVGPDRLA